MSDSDKGEILKKVAELPPEQKLVALGFLQGLTAASADSKPAQEETRPAEDEKEAQHDNP